MFCIKCGASLDTNERFCGNCGEFTSAQPPINPIQGSQPAVKNSAATVNPICIIIVIVCAILWFVAPFMAVNLLTMDNQPTALQLITGDVLLIGDITSTPAFWAAMVSVIGIVLCAIFALRKKGKATRNIAIITTIGLFLTFPFGNDNAGGIFDIIGFGYIGIFILFIIMSIISKKKN